MICFLCHSRWTCQQRAQLLPIWDTRAQVHHPLAKTVLCPAQHLLGINSSMPYKKKVMEKGYLGSGLLIWKHHNLLFQEGGKQHTNIWWRMSWRACSLTWLGATWSQDTWWCPNAAQFPWVVRPVIYSWSKNIKHPARCPCLGAADCQCCSIA